MSDLVIIKGIYQPGRGVKKDRLGPVYEEFCKRGILLMKGTFNFVAKEPFDLSTNNALFYCNGYYVWKIILNGVSCYGYRWEQCPYHILEILSEYVLKEHLNVSVGDEIALGISSSCFKRMTKVRSFGWWLAWKKREKSFYTNPYYYKFIGKLFNLKYRCDKYCNTFV